MVVPTRSIQTNRPIETKVEAVDDVVVYLGEVHGGGGVAGALLHVHNVGGALAQMGLPQTLP